MNLTATQFDTILAILRGPPGPAWPGGFDFGRDAWFKGIGGVGRVARHGTDKDHETGTAFANDGVVDGDVRLGDTLDQGAHSSPRSG